MGQKIFYEWGFLSTYNWYNSGPTLQGNFWIFQAALAVSCWLLGHGKYGNRH